MVSQTPIVPKMAVRQQIRLILLFLILLTFPITMNYLSVYLIIEGSAQGIATSSLFFWVLFTVTSVVFGRAVCGYICPLGAFQEIKDRMASKHLARIKHLKVVKYVLAVGWVGAIVWAAVYAGGYKTVNLLYNIESGVSIARAQGWIMYYIIAFVVLLPAFLIGKRGFCHHFCPWGILNTAGTKVKNYLRLPSLRLEAAPEKCKQCRTCAENCPMSLEVNRMVASGSMTNMECILCGTCTDNCPNKAVRYSWRRS